MHKALMIPFWGCWAVIFMSPLAFSDQEIKKPNVSGQFYPANPTQLGQLIDQLLFRASPSESNNPIEMMISPHAGYIYSGGVAAFGYKAIETIPYKTIVILAPSHFYEFDGVSIWKKGGFETPLGVVPVDQDFAEQLIARNDQFYFKREVYETEHSLEVQIPFLQKIFKDFKIVPIIMGQTTYELCEKLAEDLNSLIGDRTDVLMVISTDLSHYHQDSVAKEMDHRTIEAVRNRQVQEVWRNCRLRTMEMCGFIPVTTGLIYALRRGLDQVKVLNYANSGDVTGDKERVVGYTSVIFSRSGSLNFPAHQKATDKSVDAGQIKSLGLWCGVPPPQAVGQAPQGNSHRYEWKRAHLVDGQGLSRRAPHSGQGEAFAAEEQGDDNEKKVLPLTREQKRRMMEIVKQTIDAFVRQGKTLDFQESDLRFSVTEGAFVTINKNGQLRGCKGHIVTQQPLYSTLRDVAISAAAHDPRFPPLAGEELMTIDIKVSILSKPWRIKSIDEIQLGKHGVIISRGTHSGVFLPEVATETGWSKEEFLTNLCVHKAYLPPTAWKDASTIIEIFTTDHFSEDDLK